MYAILSGLPNGGHLEGQRLFEGANAEVYRYFNQPHNGFHLLRSTPVLAVPEVGPRNAEGVFARVGNITRVDRAGDGYNLTFTPDPGVPQVDAGKILENSTLFGLSSDWELHRTKLSIKDGDLYRSLLILENLDNTVRPSSKYLNFPDSLREDERVAAMMPFDGEFDEVWRSIQQACHEKHMLCSRADSIFKNDSIMDDIVSLICRAKIIVTDYSNTNPNVFYETGIAHTLGRQCIPIAQDVNSIPFDLRTQRAIIYSPNELGLEKLRWELGDRMGHILNN